VVIPLYDRQDSVALLLDQSGRSAADGASLSWCWWMTASSDGTAPALAAQASRIPDCGVVLRRSTTPDSGDGGRVRCQRWEVLITLDWRSAERPADIPCCWRRLDSGLPT